jgi:cephalosporin-C deacetylase-like acetyl esterase
LLREFGDAEIATLIAPRALIVEHSKTPQISGPPTPREGRSGAAPGKWSTPDYESVEAEYDRARALLHANPQFETQLQLISGNEGMATGPCSDRGLTAFLGVLRGAAGDLKPPGPAPIDQRYSGAETFGSLTNALAVRQGEQVKELEEFTQRLLRQSDQVRAAYFWNSIKASTPEDWKAACASFRSNLWEQVIGRLSAPASPPDPRTRKIGERPGWTGYEVVLDVCQDVFAWGYLLLPKDLKPGEHRPVVVCQHGLEGVPADVIDESTNSRAFGYYKAFAARLADRGFVVFAPHNPYRGEDRFRHLQRLANPLGLSLFSFIIAQHSCILDWLAQQPFVDPDRIAFYGLSYGGKTAMRVPAVLDRYALSICSGDFNDWISKNASTTFAGSYMFLGEYEMPEFNLGETFNYAEMAALIAPRPFMVERGHNDGVGIDEWVASEYAKVRRLYDRLGIGNRTAIEFFNGPHTIHGVGTFDFLHQWVNWPKPKE